MAALLISFHFFTNQYTLAAFKFYVIRGAISRKSQPQPFINNRSTKRLDSQSNNSYSSCHEI